MIAPWASSVEGSELTDLKVQVGVTSAIVKPSAYSASTPEDVAYLPNPGRLERLKRNGPWRLVICGDERNIDGPSGAFETPEAYNERWQMAFQRLREAGIPFTSKGLAMVNGEFDFDYHNELSETPVRAVNCAPQNWNAARAAIEELGGEWSVTIIPARLNWFPLRYNTLFRFLYQELFYPFKSVLKAAVGHPQVVNVGVWCLREVRMGNGEWQAWHGLIDRDGRVTWQGRVVKGE